MTRSISVAACRASPTRRLVAIAILGVAACASPALAAESYANCTGVIQSLPATITTPGTWCMKQGLSTSMTSGLAIDIQADDVTVDCNDFTLSGIPGGAASLVRGIGGTHRSNVSIRNCRIGGFHYGVALIGNGGGHLVEDNHLFANLYRGIYVSGGANLVRGNRVDDTGGATGSASSTAIYAAADIVDNNVARVYATAANADAVGITVMGLGTLVRDNSVTELESAGAGTVTGINVAGTQTRVFRNHLAAAFQGLGYARAGIGINGNGAASTFCSHNVIRLHTTGMIECQNTGGNFVLETRQNP